MYFDQFLSKEINNSKRKKTERKTPEECHQISFFIKVLDVKIIRISSEKLDGITMNSYLFYVKKLEIVEYWID